MNARSALVKVAPLALVVAAACGGNSPPVVASQPVVDPCLGAWVQLYEGANFSSRRFTLAYPTEQTSLRSVAYDGGTGDLNDRITSVQWSVPAGCRAVLYDAENFRGEAFQLVGSGRNEQNANLGSFNDRTSSARWDRS